MISRPVSLGIGDRAGPVAFPLCAPGRQQLIRRGQPLGLVVPQVVPDRFVVGFVARVSTRDQIRGHKVVIAPFVSPRIAYSTQQTSSTPQMIRPSISRSWSSRTKSVLCQQSNRCLTTVTEPGTGSRYNPAPQLPTAQRPSGVSQHR